MNRADCKYFWVHRSFEEELRKQQFKIQQQRKLKLDLVDLTMQLGQDMRDGRVFIEPQILRFRKGNFLADGNKRIKKL